MSAIIQTKTIQFLQDLNLNNTRDWFNEHKNEYLESQSNIVDFADALIMEMNQHDQIENLPGKKNLYRIYNDVRFKKDKSPYNPRFAFSLRRATKLKRGGYYFNIKPGNSFLACGFFAPNPEDLKRIRMDIMGDYKTWVSVLNNEEIKKNFNPMSGRQVLTVPRGFPKDHEGIEGIRLKQFILRHEFKDEELLEKDFLYKVNELYKSVRPFFDHMSMVLTTDNNGELIV